VVAFVCLALVLLGSVEEDQEDGGHAEHQDVGHHED
jgi:hypothetical protein